MPKPCLPITMTLKLQQAFLKKFRPLNDNEICWPWKGYIETNGYGRIRVNGRNYMAHRLSYMINNHIDYLSGGDSELVLHSKECNNPCCVNPKHLRLGTTKENLKQAAADGLMATGENNGNTKFSDELITAVKDWHWRYGSTRKMLAEKFGISTSQVSRILRGIHRSN